MLESHPSAIERLKPVLSGQINGSETSPAARLQWQIGSVKGGWKQMPWQQTLSFPEGPHASRPLIRTGGETFKRPKNVQLTVASGHTVSGRLEGRRLDEHLEVIWRWCQSCERNQREGRKNTGQQLHLCLDRMGRVLAQLEVGCF